MSLIDDFIEQITENYDVQVVKHNYDINGWNPLVIKVKQMELLKFISKYQYSGKWRSVQYNVTGNQITFYSKIGNDILSML